MARFLVSKNAVVKNNRLVLSLSEIPEDGEVEVLIVKHDTRTAKQNKYYRGVLLPLYRNYLQEVSGELVSDEMAHMDLQNRFIPYHNQSTSALTKEQMLVFVQQVIDFLDTLGLSVPDQTSGVTYAGTGEVFSKEALAFV